MRVGEYAKQQLTTADQTGASVFIIKHYGIPIEVWL